MKCFQELAEAVSESQLQGYMLNVVVQVYTFVPIIFSSVLVHQMNMRVKSLRSGVYIDDVKHDFGANR